jgi:hypothetical protein
LNSKGGIEVTVSRLIEELQVLDPDAQVHILHTSDDDYGYDEWTTTVLTAYATTEGVVITS